MLKLFVKDNTNGHIHEYGTSLHDALILQEDGSLHYENMQCCAGTKYPEEGYSFCLADGTVPPMDDPENDPYVDIGGEYAAEPQSNADLIRSMSDETLAEKLYHIWRSEVEKGIDLATNWCRPGYCTSEECDPDKHKACILRWLRSPAKEENGNG